MRLILSFLLLAGACRMMPPVAVSSAVFASPRPAYVYRGGGGCWIDNLWHAPCPGPRLWTVHYRHHREHYYYETRLVGGCGPHHPSSRARLSRPHRGTRYVPPSRHRDCPRYRLRYRPQRDR